MSWPCPTLSASHSDGFSPCGGPGSLATPAEAELAGAPSWSACLRIHSDWPESGHVTILGPITLVGQEETLCLSLVPGEGRSALGDEEPRIGRWMLQLCL